MLHRPIGCLQPGGTTHPSLDLSGSPDPCVFLSCMESRGGALRFELDRGVPLEPQNPHPSLRVILAQKGTHF